MIFKNKSKQAQKKFPRAAVMVFTATVAVFASQPARADIFGIIASGLGDIFGGIEKDIGQVDFNRIVDNVGKELQGKHLDQATNTLSQNMAQAAASGVGGKLASDYYIPPASSACEINASSSRAKESVRSGGAMAQAFTMANSNRPDDPLTNAKFIAERCKFHFAPGSDKSADPKASNYDPEYSAFQNMHCNGSHAHEDEVIDSLLKDLEFPIDPNMTLVNHAFKLPDNPPADGQPYPKDYYRFYAAFFYCLGTTPPQPVPPQILPGKSTTAMLAIGPYSSADGAISVGPSACFKALESRIQYGPDSVPPKFPAEHQRTDSLSHNNIKSRHDEQVDLCAADFGKHIIDSNTNEDCKKNGRSDLQAMADQAYRLGAPSNEWQNKVLNNVPDTQRESMRSQAESDQLAFEKKLDDERLRVTLSIAAANSVSHSISTVAPSPLSMTVTQ